MHKAKWVPDSKWVINLRKYCINNLHYLNWHGIKLIYMSGKVREAPLFCRALQLHNSPTDWARELFQPPTDSGSLLVYREKNVFRFVFGILCGWRHNGACIRAFLVEVTCLGRQSKTPFFSSSLFLILWLKSFFWLKLFLLWEYNSRMFCWCCSFKFVTTGDVGLKFSRNSKIQTIFSLLFRKQIKKSITVDQVF